MGVFDLEKEIKNITFSNGVTIPQLGLGVFKMKDEKELSEVKRSALLWRLATAISTPR